MVSTPDRRFSGEGTSDASVKNYLVYASKGVQGDRECREALVTMFIEISFSQPFWFYDVRS